VRAAIGIRGQSAEWMMGFELRVGQTSLARVDRHCPKLCLTILVLLPPADFDYNCSPFLRTVMVSFPSNASCSMTRSSALLLGFVSIWEPSTATLSLSRASSVVVLRVRVGVAVLFFIPRLSRIESTDPNSS
jgi:hypothetical protein